MKKVWALLLLPLFLFGCTTGLEVPKQTEKEKTMYEGVILDKHFVNGTSSSGVGVTADGTVGMMSSSTSDAYTIFLEEGKYELPYKVWIHLEKGDKIQYTKGFFVIDIVGLKRKADVEREETEKEKETTKPENEEGTTKKTE